MAYMLAHMEIVQSTIFGNASTAISIIAGAVILGEPLTIYHILCAALILVGVIGLALAPAPEENSGKKLEESKEKSKKEKQKDDEKPEHLKDEYFPSYIHLLIK